MSHGFKTEEEAIEAWNTWRGRYEDVGQETFCKCNPCNAGGLVVNDAGDYTPLPAQDMVDGVVLLLNGAFTVPWPRLTPGQAVAVRALLNRPDPVEYAFSLCARWCALFPSVVEYRENLTALLRANDRDNLHLNAQLRKWNGYLTEHGFEPFESNDLRGVNLSGLQLHGEAYAGISLRNLDLSFSELSLAQLTGANLYGARLCGVNSACADFQFSICSSVDFSHSCLSRVHFDGADMGSAVLRDCLCHRATFEGAVLHYADFTRSQCTEISLRPLTYQHHGVARRRYTELDGIVYSEANFRGTPTQETDWTKNPELRGEIERQNRVFSKEDKGSIWNRLVQATELKPGWHGFSLDLKRLFKRGK